MKTMTLDFLSNFSDFGNLVRSLPTLFSNMSNMVLNRHDKRAPLYLTWVPTYRCNVTCEHCNWAVTRANLGKELNRQECLELAEQLSRSKIMAITFSGGEPLIFEHLFEIIERVNQRDNKLVNVVTNGWLLRKYADRLLDSNISSITVSIDSHRPEAHDRFRNKEGLFERAIEGIAYIRSKRKNKPKILLRATITRDNINEIDKFIDFFKDKVDHIAFQPVSNTKGHTTRNDNILFSEQDREYFSKLIYGYIDRHPFMNNLYYKSLAKYFLNHDLLIKDKAFRCLFWSNCVLIIEPWGDAYPCLRFTNTENAPNVRSQPIIDIWRSNRMRAMKETMCDTKEKCSCWGYNQYISLYLTRLNKFIPMRGCLY